MKIMFTLKAEEMLRTTIVKTLVFASKLESKISVNFDKSNISIDFPNDIKIETFIDFIFDNFEISKIDIENGEFAVSSVSTPATVTSSEAFTAFECTSDLDSTAEDDNTAEIESLLSRLSKSLNWLVKNKNIRSKTIAAYLLTLRTELQLNFANENPVEFDVGNIVEIYYGIHMSNEMQGISAPGIVVKKQDNLAFVVPLGSFKQNEVNFELVKDIDFTYFYDSSFTSTYASLARGQFINENRVTKILGNLRPASITSLKKALPNAFNFNKDNTIVDASLNVSTTNTNSEFSSFNEFISTHKSFTAKELCESFPNISKNTIYNWTYSAKKKGLITSEKRGEYKTNL